jgi:hypothetical protein
LRSKLQSTRSGKFIELMCNRSDDEKEPPRINECSCDTPSSASSSVACGDVKTDVIPIIGYGSKHFSCVSNVSQNKGIIFRTD